MPQEHTSSLSGYKQALEGAAYFMQPSPGYLRVSGPDRLAFLQRQTTNDVQLLSPTRAVVSVLTNPAARILDVLTLLDEPEAIGALTLPGRSAETLSFLRSRIFFMDKVSVENRSAELLQIELGGPATAEILARLGFEREPKIDEALSGEMAGSQARLLGSHGLGFRLLAPAGQEESVSAALSDLGAARLSPESYAILQVEAGLPTAGHELSEEYTPLETGLGYAISDNKGCYTGQEVIARQITYDKVTRRLVGLVLEGPVEVGSGVYPEEEQRAAGTVTSTAVSPRFGPLALAILRRPHDEPDRRVRVGTNGEGVRGKVTRLPFTGD